LKTTQSDQHKTADNDRNLPCSKTDLNVMYAMFNAVTFLCLDLHWHMSWSLYVFKDFMREVMVVRFVEIWWNS
jgi:hypothetical protein